MTDKIIIDGIDVSECMWFIRAEGRYVKDYCCCYMEFDICQEKTDCYYKQLQRKTAECEELKIKLIQKDEVNAFFNTPIDGWSSDPCAICESKNEYLHYKQVLDEIKKLITDNDNYFTKDILDIISKAKENEND